MESCIMCLAKYQSMLQKVCYFFVVICYCGGVGRTGSGSGCCG